MQITNNTTTVNLNEEKLLNLIIDQRIVKLERVFETLYNVKFKDISTNVFHTHLYLCVVQLGLTASEITDVYNIGLSELTRIVKACHTKMLINKVYQNNLKTIHTKCIKLKIAA